MNNVARTIMVSNEVYAELKKKKGTKSFSEVIKEALSDKPKKIKTAGELLDFSGLIPTDDGEHCMIMKESKKT
ncbi:hypothetical protein HYU11_04350 [Candidatus Woesearchaeota archaeon]|nr:hypothetical protein [Candidatus Woesearchaeota archaeon]